MGAQVQFKLHIETTDPLVSLTETEVENVVLYILPENNITAKIIIPMASTLGTASPYWYCNIDSDYLDGDYYYCVKFSFKSNEYSIVHNPFNGCDSSIMSSYRKTTYLVEGTIDVSSKGKPATIYIPIRFNDNSISLNNAYAYNLDGLTSGGFVLHGNTSGSNIQGTLYSSGYIGFNMSQITTGEDCYIKFNGSGGASSIDACVANNPYAQALSYGQLMGMVCTIPQYAMYDESQQHYATDTYIGLHKLSDISIEVPHAYGSTINPIPAIINIGSGRDSIRRAYYTDISTNKSFYLSKAGPIIAQINPINNDGNLCESKEISVADTLNWIVSGTTASIPNVHVEQYGRSLSFCFSNGKSGSTWKIEKEDISYKGSYFDNNTVVSVPFHTNNDSDSDTALPKISFYRDGYLPKENIEVDYSPTYTVVDADMISEKINDRLKLATVSSANDLLRNYFNSESNVFVNGPFNENPFNKDVTICNEGTYSFGNRVKFYQNYAFYPYPFTSQDWKEGEAINDKIYIPLSNLGIFSNDSKARPSVAMRINNDNADKIGGTFLIGSTPFSMPTSYSTINFTDGLPNPPIYRVFKNGLFGRTNTENEIALSVDMSRLVLSNSRDYRFIYATYEDEYSSSVLNFTVNSMPWVNIHKRLMDKNEVQVSETGVSVSISVKDNDRWGHLTFHAQTGQQMNKAAFKIIVAENFMPEGYQYTLFFVPVSLPTANTYYTNINLTFKSIAFINKEDSISHFTVNTFDGYTTMAFIIGNIISDKRSAIKIEECEYEHHIGATTYATDYTLAYTTQFGITETDKERFQ